MDATTISYGMTTTVDLPYERAVERTREALGAEGFGVLTEIDVKATFRKKLDVCFLSAENILQIGLNLDPLAIWCRRGADDDRSPTSSCAVCLSPRGRSP